MRRPTCLERRSYGKYCAKRMMLAIGVSKDALTSKGDDSATVWECCEEKEKGLLFGEQSIRFALSSRAHAERASDL